ncbi:glycosyltransferase involved in cell wall bisynthesis [Jatrophihabitans sp. GAS493]|uniref:glycosyltransferase family 4 protein n=1 Tax=Jatrophihabitans sp. GAS493 TaxID=1907575 RepID=UPI000BC035A0|nr:glycosyltransferase family 4 protein [Jatrophihabitans sp. GAS493]SOD70594.1 glycosyltransferase involved in cell wall bisynthesis [Jatrophihabitans sp. GAS493]
MTVGRRIAIITSDVLTATMAGPAIRAVNVAAVLAAEGHDVTLVSTSTCEIERAEFRCRRFGWDELQAGVAEAEILIVQGFVTRDAPWLLRSEQILVIDLYDPMQFEQLEQTAELPRLARTAALDLTTRIFNDQLVRGDFFLCASEQQRHLWLGQLAAMGRINPANYDRDATLESLLAICPFGLAEEPPARTGPGIRGVAGIGEHDKVLLWAGGVYNWFDPLTLIRAVQQVSHQHADVRLFFLGMKHPNPGVPQMQMAWDARELSDSLGLTDRHVFFNEGWVPYDERANFLLDADAGVSTHLMHVETSFSFRTRILDYLWAGLPIVSTGGDSFGELVATAELGVRVEAGDVAGLADAISRVLYDPEFAATAAANAVAMRERFTWPVALAPLVRFCAEAKRAADADGDLRRLARQPVIPTSALGRQLMRASTLRHEGGLGLVAGRTLARLRRVFGS